MSEQNANSTPATVATTDQAVEYITNALTNGELHMKEACKELGWSFPRIRSRSLTIAKKMKCVFTKVNRGVYILEPINDNSTEAPVEAAGITSDAVVESDDTKGDDDHTLDPDEVEAALLGDSNNTPNV